jgi:hypothetical protein
MDRDCDKIFDHGCVGLLQRNVEHFSYYKYINGLLPRNVCPEFTPPLTF